MEIIFAIFLICAVGGFIQRVSGFGFGIFVMLFLPHLITPHTESAAISTLVSCAISTVNAFIYRKNVPYKKVLPLLLGALFMIPFSVAFSTHISGDNFKKFLGVVLILLSIYFLFLSKRIKIKPTFTNGLMAGGISGILTGLFSTGGPPVVLYLVNALEGNAVYFASTQFFFGITGIYSTAVRALNGIITSRVLVYSVLGFCATLIGNLAGKLVFDKLPAEKLKQIIYLCMIASGIIMMI